MNKNIIEFSADGTEFAIKFANGSETMNLSSKEEGFEAIVKLEDAKKITKEEFVEMGEQILKAENLPDGDDSDTEIKLISVGIMGNSFMREIIFSLLMRDILNQSDEPVEIACLKICNCKKHAKILTKECYTIDSHSKKHLMLCLEKLKEDGHVDEKEFYKVKEEIEVCSLEE
ncbi:MAG: hypothetical protein WAV23_03160 [Minisyncoccia bacterium]